MNRNQTVQAVIWLDQLCNVAKAEASRFREELLADATAEYTEQGTAPTWRIPDLATVTAAVARDAVSVTDPDALRDWVSKRYPEQTHVVVTVRPAWLSQFLEAVKPFGDVAVDPDTGEVVPGLTVRAGGRINHISIRPTSDARTLFGALAATGLQRLALDAGPNIPVAITEAAQSTQDAATEEKP